MINLKNKIHFMHLSQFQGNKSYLARHCVYQLRETEPNLNNKKEICVTSYANLIPLSGMMRQQ